MSSSYLSIGSNIGDRLFYINKAKNFIRERIGVIIMESKLYETEPWGFIDEKYFLNMVVHIETDLNCKDLLEQINIIEKESGRVRHQNSYASRTIDIDILFYDNFIINEPDLIIPHPRLHLRKFSLIPLNEINGDFIHPVFNKTIKTLLEECDDNFEVRIF